MICKRVFESLFYQTCTLRDQNQKNSIGELYHNIDFMSMIFSKNFLLRPYFLRQAMKNRSHLSLILFLSLFTAICVMLCSVSIAFCKWKDSSTATNAQNHLQAPTIIIDAGHGGEDGGAVGKNGALEKELNLSISEKMHDLLSAAGYKVVMTRDTDILLYDKNVDYKGRKKELDLAKRVEIANSYENAVFISIHTPVFIYTLFREEQVALCGCRGQSSQAGITGTGHVSFPERRYGYRRNILCQNGNFVGSRRDYTCRISRRTTDVYA